MAEFPNKLSRREFLKLVAVGAGVAVLNTYSEPFDFYGPSLPEKSLHKNQAAVFIMPSWNSVDDDIAAFENALDHRVQGLSFFADLDQKPPNPTLVENTLASGRAVMINLQPRPTGDPKDEKNLFTPQTFTDKRHDRVLSEVAHNLSKFGNTPIFIRFAFEMNLPPKYGFNWGGDPEGFKETWRYVVDFFRNNGAGNVKWVFSPNYLPEPERIGRYYPGDDLVDVVGADIYNWEKLPADFAVNKINYYLRKVAPGKPLIVSEIGSSGEEKDDWLSDAVLINLKQGVSALNYFQFDKERAWRISDSKTVPKARRIFSSGVFLRNEADLDEINRTILTVN